MKQNLIVITGGIGTGKSVISRICRLKGFPVYDCDRRASILMNTSCELKESLTRLCGAEIYRDGSLCRDRMAELIFGSEKMRREVNALVHEAVRRDIKQWSESQLSPVVFVESAIATTARLTANAAAVWLTEAPAELRIRRVELRNGLPRKCIEERMKAQEHEFESLPADLTERILNDGDTPLLDRVNTLIDKFLHQNN